MFRIRLLVASGPISVVLSTTTPLIHRSQTAQIQAQVSGSSSAALTWEPLTNVDGGQITVKGAVATFTPGAFDPGVFTHRLQEEVKAISTIDASKWDFVKIIVEPDNEIGCSSELTVYHASEDLPDGTVGVAYDQQVCEDGRPDCLNFVDNLYGTPYGFYTYLGQTDASYTQVNSTPLSGRSRRISTISL